MKNLKICLILLCLSTVRSVGMPQSDGANFFMKEIKLTQGKFALVDDEDFEWLNQWKWQLGKRPKTEYALRNIRVDGLAHKKTVYMHRLIMKAEKSKNIDHRDHNGLNNQKYNLREATAKQNGANRTSNTNSSSKYLGVSWDKKSKKWKAYINYTYLGLFVIETDAALAYNKKAIDIHGEFANLNILP